MITIQVPVPLAAATAAQPGEARDAGAPDDAATTDGTSFAALVAGFLPGTQGTDVPAPEAAHGAAPTPESGGHWPGPSPDPAQDAAAAIEHAFAIAVAPVTVAPSGASGPGDPAAAPARDGTDARRSLEPSRAGALSVRGDGEAQRGRAGAEARSATPSTLVRDPGLALPGTEASTRAAAPVPDPALPGQQSTDAAATARSPETPIQPALRFMVAAAPESTLRIASPLGTPSWRDELAGSVSILVRNATSEAQIRVTPAELGPVHARISLDGGTASVVFSAPTQEVRDALEGSLGALRERLAESGLTLGEASVSGEPASRFANQDQREAPEDGRGAVADGATPSAQAVRGLRRDGLIDLYA